MYMYNQHGIIALFEGCGWVLLERTNGEQYTCTGMYETDRNKEREAQDMLYMYFYNCDLLYVHAVSWTILIRACFVRDCF